MLHSLVRDLGGLVATHELHAAGLGRTAISAAVRNRQLARVRQGWYGLPGTHPDLVRAARVGGRLSCLSLLALRGCWTVRDTGLHIAIERGSCRLRHPGDHHRRLTSGSTGVARDDVVTHWSERDNRSRLMVEDRAALGDLFSCQPDLVVAAVADSAFRNVPGIGAAWSAIVADAPVRLRSVLERVDGVCESGTETVVWQRGRGWPARIRRQVEIGGVGRVDFVLGERLVVEVDSFRWHEDRERFEADRRRDAALSAFGYRVLRFSYEQVMERWNEVEAAVLAALVRGDHR